LILGDANANGESTVRRRRSVRRDATACDQRPRTVLSTLDVTGINNQRFAEPFGHTPVAICTSFSADWDRTVHTSAATVTVTPHDAEHCGPCRSKNRRSERSAAQLVTFAEDAKERGLE
jgi:hypothetical protein